MGSYNSLPHFRNIEYHLDALLNRAANSSATTLRLSPLELYLLLSSVLFHDFGRVYGDQDHADKSAKKLPELHHQLGIPTLELASSLSRIARYHDPFTAEDKSKDHTHREKVHERIKLALREVRLEPYGIANELHVGTLLALADHMDASVRRAVPAMSSPKKTWDLRGPFGA